MRIDAEVTMLTSSSLANCGRLTASGEIRRVVKLLREKADGLEKLADETENLGKEADAALWRVICDMEIW